MLLLVSFYVCEAKKKSRSSEVVLSSLQETLVLVRSYITNCVFSLSCVLL